jgi:acetolactate synthase-1/3 small subunit
LKFPDPRVESPGAGYARRAIARFGVPHEGALRGAGPSRDGASRDPAIRQFVCLSYTSIRHIVSLLLENEAGALSRVSGLFSARGYNIESLTVAPTEDPTLSRMTIVTTGSDDVIEQITKQLNKLVDVVKVVDLSDGEHIERELMLVKVRAAGKDREEMNRMAEIFRGRIIDVTDKSYTIELTGTGSKLDAFLNAIERSAILETVRTGASGIGRGDRVLKI